MGVVPTPNDPWKVLVLPGGTEIGLEVQRSFSQNRFVVLHAAGENISSHAPFVFKNHFHLPSVHQEDYLTHLNRLVTEQNIDFIFPAHDDVVLVLARDSDRIRARVVTSPFETCEIARSKSRTYSRLAGAIPVPAVYEDLHAISTFPVFAKPDRGQGSQRTHLVVDQDGVRSLRMESSDYIFMEYLPGPEYTIDCFSHRSQGLLYCEGRERLRTRSGISMSSRFERRLRERFQEYARAIASRLTFHGAWFFQLKADAAGELTLLEVAPRIAGTMALSRVRGVNFAVLSLYEQLGTEIRILLNDDQVEIDRALVNRYRTNFSYNTVYVDLDDTLIVRGQVNTLLIRFLYQCLNKGIRLILVTRHRDVISSTLERFRLGTLFDEVIRVAEPDLKSQHLQERNAILIDDSFRERMDAHSRCGIPTFDSSMIEALIDERE
jgi:hypothetical protein